MKVRDLKQLLEDMGDDDADVIIVYQPSWPLESRCVAAMARYELYDDEDDDDMPTHTDDEDQEQNGKKNDFLIVAGHSDLRYGSKRCWES